MKAEIIYCHNQISTIFYNEYHVQVNNKCVMLIVAVENGKVVKINSKRGFEANWNNLTNEEKTAVDKTIYELFEE